MAKIGIYGGSFNPIHYGHVGLAEWVAAHTDLDEVWLMVSPNNPLKRAESLADERTRLREAQRAVEGKANILVSDFEFQLPRPNYTANTLRELTRQYPQHIFTLIIGEDNVPIFNQWRDYTYILDNYRIFVYPRRGYRMDTTYNANMHLLQDAPYFDISSTEIRNNLQVLK